MLKMNNLYYGWKGTGISSTIPGFVKTYPAAISDFHYATISCVDSNRVEWLHSTFPSYAKDREDEEIQYQLTPNGILVNVMTLSRIVANEDFLSGFDEIWFSVDRPALMPSVDLPLTSELAITDTRHLDSVILLSRWIMKTSYVLGLGDGIGLNYVTTDEVIAKVIDVD